MKINLHIDRLVLQGVSIDTHQRGVLQQSLQDELTHLLATQGVAAGLQSDRSVRAVRAQSVSFVSGDSAEQFGGQIANAVYRGINR